MLYITAPSLIQAMTLHHVHMAKIITEISWIISTITNAKFLNVWHFSLYPMNQVTTNTRLETRKSGVLKLNNLHRSSHFSWSFVRNWQGKYFRWLFFTFPTSHGSRQLQRGQPSSPCSKPKGQSRSHVNTPQVTVTRTQINIICNDHRASILDQDTTNSCSLLPNDQWLYQYRAQTSQIQQS